MPNPTTAKPTNAEWDSTANPNLQFLCVFNQATGAPLDLVGLVPGRGYNGFGLGNSGKWPTPATATFGGVTAQQTYQFPWGGQALYWYNRGWASGTSVASPRTLAVVFRHSFLSAANAYNAALTIPVLSSCIDLGSAGIAIQVSTAGVVTLGYYRGSAFVSASRVLTAGTWYAVAVTFGTSTARVVNVYDYTAQAADTQASTVDSAYSFSSQNPHVTVNSGINSQYSGDIEVYSAMLANETWDSGTNGRFAAFFADPAVWGRGSYASPGGALVAGTAGTGELTKTSVAVSASRPSAGVLNTAGTAYTHQWHRSTATPNFTPGAGTLLTGATSPTLVDSTVNPGTDYYYKDAQSDGTTTVNTNAVAGRTLRGVGQFAFIGDSLSNTTNAPVPAFTAMALFNGWRFGVINRANPSMFARASTSSPSLSWAPGIFILSAATATSGNIVLSWKGQLSNAFAFNASAATVKTALEACPTIGAGNATVVGSAITTSYFIQLAGTALSPFAGSSSLAIDGTSTFVGTGQQVYGNYSSAMAQFLADAVTDLNILLGTNDGTANTTQAAYQTAISAIATDAVAAGIARVHLHAPPWRATNTDAQNELLLQYQAALAAVANGTTILYSGKALAWDYSAATPGSLQDGTHFQTGDYPGHGAALWLEVASKLDPGAVGVGGSGGGYSNIGLGL